MKKKTAFCKWQSFKNKRAKMALQRSPELEMTLPNSFFFGSLLEKNLQELLYVHTVHVTPIH